MSLCRWRDLFSVGFHALLYELMSHPAKPWEHYLKRIFVEEAVKMLRGDLVIRLIYHLLAPRIFAPRLSTKYLFRNEWIAFMQSAYMEKSFKVHPLPLCGRRVYSCDPEQEAKSQI